MGFKLIAVRPLSGCKTKFRKNLQPGKPYVFYNDYTFVIGEAKDNLSIKHKATIPNNFFDVDREIDTGVFERKNVPISISISALAGKNGSGKSAVSELFIISLFVLSRNLRFFYKNHFINTASRKFVDIDEENRYDTEVKEIDAGLKAEIYYSIDSDIYKIIIDSGKVFYQLAIYDTDKGEYTFVGEPVPVKSKKDLPAFFYSILVNYSFYGFNTNEIGMWIKAFFHKNDGYQMPIVLNPYRKEGNMDINTENYLTGARLLANILSIDSYKEINPIVPIKEIELYFDNRKDYKFLTYDMRRRRFSNSFIMEFRDKVIAPLYTLTFGKDYGYPLTRRRLSMGNLTVKEYAEVYLIQKLITIPARYSIFKDFNGRIDKEELHDNFDFAGIDSDEYVKALYKDRSHITTKVRQVLNFLQDNIFEVEFEKHNVIPLSDAVARMQVKANSMPFTEMIDYIPPPFLVSRIRFEDDSHFHTMSSGEKQKIFVLNSVIYHLKNIDSVHKNSKENNKKGIIAYEHINLFFDEIELYYHPEFQKQIVSELLEFIRKAEYKFIKSINIIFLTHSPFILSDIPNQNILYLEQGDTLEQDQRPKKSFGANITDLLADSFFIRDGLMGNYAKNKIQKVIDAINDKDILLKKECEDIICLIDEPLLRRKLSEMYSAAFNDDLELKMVEEELALLQRRKEKLIAKK